MMVGYGLVLKPRRSRGEDVHIYIDTLRIEVDNTVSFKIGIYWTNIPANKVKDIKRIRE